jgi:hypothetical protein
LAPYRAKATLPEAGAVVGSASRHPVSDRHRANRQRPKIFSPKNSACPQNFFAPKSVASAPADDAMKLAFHKEQ